MEMISVTYLVRNRVRHAHIAALLLAFASLGVNTEAFAQENLRQRRPTQSQTQPQNRNLNQKPKGRVNPSLTGSPNSSMNTKSAPRKGTSGNGPSPTTPADRANGNVQRSLPNSARTAPGKIILKSSPPLGGDANGNSVGNSLIGSVSGSGSGSASDRESNANRSNGNLSNGSLPRTSLISNSGSKIPGVGENADAAAGATSTTLAPGEEESVDLSMEAESSFNPYLFSREPLWALLPLLTLLFLGLHLLPVPKRRKHRKITADQFLGELKKSSGGGKNMGIAAAHNVSAEVLKAHGELTGKSRGKSSGSTIGSTTASSAPGTAALISAVTPAMGPIKSTSSAEIAAKIPSTSNPFTDSSSGTSSGVPASAFTKPRGHKK